MEQQNNRKHRKSCPVCGSSSFESYLETRDYFLTKEEFSIVKCENCDFIFTNPIPQLEHLSEYYDSPDYLSHTVSKFSLTGFVYNTLRNINIKNKYKLVCSLNKGGKILDIGQGTGEFLSYFKNKGWDTLGIEPNQMARKYAIEKHNLEVYDENKLDEFESNSFDVITMWHVLEHVPDLENRIKQLNRLVKKNGVIIIALPNIESPDAKKYGERWAGLDVPRHLYHFSESSLKRLLSNHNLKLVNKFPMRFDAYYVCLLSEKYKGNKLPHISAMVNGYTSNRKAKKKNNYSSMIFVAKQN